MYCIQYFKSSRSWTWQDLHTQIRLEPELDLVKLKSFPHYSSHAFGYNSKFCPSVCLSVKSQLTTLYVVFIFKTFIMQCWVAVFKFKSFYISCWVPHSRLIIHCNQPTNVLSQYYANLCQCLVQEPSGFLGFLLPFSGNMSRYSVLVHPVQSMHIDLFKLTSSLSVPIPCKTFSFGILSLHLTRLLQPRCLTQSQQDTAAL